MFNRTFTIICFVLFSISVKSFDLGGMKYEELLKNVNPPPPKQMKPDIDNLNPLPENPTSPPFENKFWCDPDFSINTVRDEVMTYANYSR